MRFWAALKMAKREFDNARYFADWEERRDIFAALDLLDQTEGPGAEQAFYLVVSLLKELNARKGLDSSTPES